MEYSILYWLLLKVQDWANGQCVSALSLGVWRGGGWRWVNLKLFTSDWDFNPRDWDLNPAKTHGTWFQDLMKFRFLVSAQKEFSERQSDR